MSDDGETFYHYTDKHGAKGIAKSGRIKASKVSAKTDDARYGDGAYFTKLDPAKHSKQAIAKNNYDGSSNFYESQVNQGKVDYVVQTKLPKGSASRENTTRDVYRYSNGDVRLDKENTKIYKVPGKKN